MSGGRRRGKGGHGGEFHVDERWMTSYADMITVLMCLFIVLYAMSTVNSHKFDVLKNSLASGFGVTPTHQLTLSNGVPIPKNLVDKHGVGFSKSTSQTAVEKTEASDSAANEPDTKNLAAKLVRALKAAGVAADAEVKVTARGVTIGLIGSSTYFGGNDATLQPQGYRVLSAIGPVLRGEQKVITVEGHADPHGSAGQYGSDWALAAARATTVLTWLVGHGDSAPTRITEISYGSAYPVTSSADDANRNRRVDIVVHEPAAAAAPEPATTGKTAVKSSVAPSASASASASATADADEKTDAASK